MKVETKHLRVGDHVRWPTAHGLTNHGTITHIESVPGRSPDVRVWTSAGAAYPCRGRSVEFDVDIDKYELTIRVLAS